MAEAREVQRAYRHLAEATENLALAKEAVDKARWTDAGERIDEALAEAANAGGVVGRLEESP